MNWYKLANIWDELKQHGPGSDYEPQEFVDFIKQTTGDNEEALEYALTNPSMREHFKRDFFTQNY